MAEALLDPDRVDPSTSGCVDVEDLFTLEHIADGISAAGIEIRSAGTN
jgi:hypothetical protein